MGFNLSIRKTRIMVSGPITSWQRDGEAVERVPDFVFWGSKITADGGYSHEIKRRLLRGRKGMTNVDGILKSRDTTLPTKVRLVKAMVFPVLSFLYSPTLTSMHDYWQNHSFEWMDLCWQSNAYAV